MGTTSIEWTEKTWNPLRGCSPVSPGCKNCYAERIAARFSGPGQPFEGFAKWRTKSGAQDIAQEDLHLWAPGEREPAWTGKTALIPKKLIEPLSWTGRHRVFVNSMSDLFHEGFTFAEIATVFSIMAIGRHTYQILTKRIDRALEFFAWMEQREDQNLGTLGDLYGLHVSPMRMPEETFDDDRHPADDDLEAIYDAGWPLDNVWLGVSAENQRFYDERVPMLLRCPAAKRFVSYEPALGEVKLGLHKNSAAVAGHCVDINGDWWHEPGTCRDPICGGRCCAPVIDWVIVGGESGHEARVFDVAWARSVVEECKAAHVPVFVKQLGAKPQDARSGDQYVFAPVPLRLKSKKGGDIEEWPADLRIREFPA